MKKPLLIVILGPTAVGKTALAIEVAKEFNSDIFSSDSRQFYKELSIGTAKPNKEELAAANHHFINSLSINEEYNADKFEKDVLEQLNQYFKKKDIAILCGGSGMYINAVLNGFDEDLPKADDKIRMELNSLFEEKGIESLQNILKSLDPEYYELVDKKNSKRLLRAIEVCRISGRKYSELRKGNKKDREFDTIKIGIEMKRELLYSRINKRVNSMMEGGLLEEVKTVYKYKGHNALKTVGYTELFDFLEGKKSLEQAIEKIKVNSRRYAKRQMTWFKKDNSIKWFPQDDKTEIIQYIRNRI